MAQPQRSDDRYTYADYITWDDDVRYELVDGVPYAMSAPTEDHQRLSGDLFRQLSTFLYGKSYQIRSAPYDVRLDADTDGDIVVQPDIVIICDRSKIGRRGCIGAPDMVIEILSESSFTHDTHTKFKLYQAAGVREYWIVNPFCQTIQAHILDDGRYYTSSYSNDGDMPVHILEGCIISLTDVFADTDDTDSPADEQAL